MHVCSYIIVSMRLVIYPFFSTTIAGTCITANLPRCLPSTMQNATPMTVTLSDGEHEVLFSATSCEPGKQLDSYYRPGGIKIALIRLTGTCGRVRTLACKQKLGGYGGMFPQENFLNLTL